MRGGTVTFTKVELGIAGQEYFEALSGVSVGDTVVAGPYQAIRDLKNGEAVRSDASAPARNQAVVMQPVNGRRVLIGGLLAGLAMNVGHRLAEGLGMRGEMERTLGRLGLPPPVLGRVALPGGARTRRVTGRARSAHAHA